MPSSCLDHALNTGQGVPEAEETARMIRHIRRPATACGIWWSASDAADRDKRTSAGGSKMRKAGLFVAESEGWKVIKVLCGKWCARFLGIDKYAVRSR